MSGSSVPLSIALTAGGLAVVNPCAFPLLPAFLSFYLGADEQRLPAARTRALQGLLVGALVAAGFLAVFAVVGLPLRMDGTVGDAAERVMRFIRELQHKLQIPIVPYNERLTSREADEILRERGADARERRARSDEIAAAIILQDYLNDHARSREAEIPKYLTRH